MGGIFFGTMSRTRSPVSCAYEHTIATDPQGNVWGWGKNDINQLGLEKSSRFCKSPQRINGVPPIHSVSCGLTHVAAIDLNKNLWTWGWNHYGQLGYGHSQLSSKPEKITELPAILEISCGANHTLALDDGGKVWMWGLSPANQLENCNQNFLTRPFLVVNLPNIVSISAGGNYSAAIDSHHTVWVWGSYASSWTYIDPRACLPHKLDNIPPIISISCGLTHAVAIDINNNLLAWGQNTYGQLGICDPPWHCAEQSVPTEIKHIPKISFISCGETATTALDMEGKPWIWGKIFINRRSPNSHFLTSSGVPIPLECDEKVHFQYISCGAFHIVGVDVNEDVWCWGDNDRGQLGLGHTQQQRHPQQIESMKLSPVKLTPLKQKSSRTSSSKYM